MDANTIRNSKAGIVSRRAVLGAAVLIPATACATRPATEPFPLSRSATYSLYPKTIDTATDTRPHLDAMKSAGVWTVFRYYARERQDFLPEKRLTRGEASELIDAGFSIGTVYQYFNNVRANINAARGREDAEYAVEEARVGLNQPSGSAIYFGIDGDWVGPEAEADIAGYFRSVRRAFEGSGFRVGVYGSGATLGFLERHPERLVDYLWLAYPQGWSGAASAFTRGTWRLFQSALETRLGGLSIDANIVNPAFSDFGQWGARGVDYAHPPAASRAIVGARRFVATRSAKLRVLPDDTALELVSPRFRKGAAVRLLEARDGWAALDVNETGSRTGYARLSDLTADFTVRPDFNAPDA